VEVDDLKSIRTFGFRGEALASASMVGRVGITSRIRPRRKEIGPNVHEGECSDSDGDSPQQPTNCAFKMQYKDGAPDPATNPRSKPKPSAGREGTVIQVQDLFYNIPSRRRAMEGRRSERDEYDRTLNVVQRYAVHEAKRGVGFLCRGDGIGGKAKAKKGARGGFGSNRTDLNTQSLASVKKIQERRKRARLSSSATQTQQSNTEEEMFAATKDVIGHIFGAAVTRELLLLTAGEGNVEEVSVAALKAMVQNKNDGTSDVDNTNGTNGNQSIKVGKDGVESSESDKFTNSLLEEMMMGEVSEEPTKIPPDSSEDNETSTTSTQPSKFAFAYKATGLITNGSYSAPKSSAAFLLFINDRLVESSSLRRSVESVYADTLPKGGKPFIYLSLELPGPHIDVNVHPTKREVAFLHEDRLCDAVSAAVRGVIAGATTSRTFSVATNGKLLPKEEGDDRSDLVRKKRRLASMEYSSSKENDGTSANVGRSASSDHNEKVSSTIAEDIGSDFADTEMGDDATRESNAEREGTEKKTPKKRAAEADGKNKTASSSVKNPYNPSKLIRTDHALPLGALEPFLVQKETKVSSGKNVNKKADISLKETNEVTTVKHKPECPLANNRSGVIDMTMPGAFASAICRCQIERAESLPPASTNGIVVRTNKDSSKNSMVRAKKITKTPCEYESVENLREEFDKLKHQNLIEMLRDCTYVGAVSRSRSLIQCGIDLIMVNHRILSREMFYQVALLKFNGMPMAKLGGGGVDVLAVIGQMLQFEEDLNSSTSASKNNPSSSAKKANKTNADLARQATACLAEKAPMLEEYFSIKLEKVKVYSDRQKQKEVTSLRITGLPILLEGHSPQPHGLPLFLLRLATEVDWTDEQSCFKGVCTELASFYSDLPFDPSYDPEDAGSSNPDYIDDEAKNYIKHTLFPAISFYLVPPKNFANDGAVIKLANLTSLYRVFERC